VTICKINYQVPMFFQPQRFLSSPEIHYCPTTIGFGIRITKISLYLYGLFNFNYLSDTIFICFMNCVIFK
jgi:hypothetical protein